MKQKEIRSGTANTETDKRRSAFCNIAITPFLWYHNLKILARKTEVILVVS